MCPKNSPLATLESIHFKLTDGLEASVLKGTKVAFLPVLGERFTYLLRQQGESNNSYRYTEKVKLNLRLHFGKRVTFFQPESRSEPCMMYACCKSDTVQVAHLLEDACEGQNSGTLSSDEEGDTFPANASPVDVEGFSGLSTCMVSKLRKDEVVDVYHAALFLRQEVLAVQPPPRPAFGVDLVSATPYVPDLLYNFLA